MPAVVFRIIGCHRVLSASSAPEMTQQILTAVNDMGRPFSVSLQIAIIRKSDGGFDWGDICLIPGMGRWRHVTIKTLISVRNELWAAMLHANHKWQRQNRLIEEFVTTVAEPLPPRLVGQPANCKSYELSDNGWREIKKT